MLPRSNNSSGRVNGGLRRFEIRRSFVDRGVKEARFVCLLGFFCCNTLSATAGGLSF